MKKNYLFYSLCLIASFFSCEKDTPNVLQLEEVTYFVDQINTPDCPGDELGTIIKVTLRYSGGPFVFDKLVNQYVFESGSGGKNDLTILQENIVGEDQLVFEWCYTFEDNSWVEEKYKVIAQNEMGATLESNEVKLTISRPPGAN